VNQAVPSVSQLSYLPACKALRSFATLRSKMKPQLRILGLFSSAVFDASALFVLCDIVTVW